MRWGEEITINKRWVWVAAALLTAGAVGYLLWSRGGQFRWDLFATTFRRLDWGWLGFSAVVALATYYGRAVRWAVFLKPLRARPSHWNLFKATVIGFSAVVLLGRAGEFVRPYLIAAKENVSISSQLAAWVLERIFDLLFALLVFGFALSRLRRSALPLGPALTWTFQVGGNIAWIAGAICLILLVLLRRYTSLVRQRLLDALGFLREHHLSRVTELLDAFIDGLESLRSTPAVVLVAAYTILEWALIVGCYASVMKAFGSAFPFSLTNILILMGFVAFGAVIQLPGVGGGVQVVAALVLHEVFGIPIEVATSMALVLWGITFVEIIPFGLLLALQEGLSWTKLRAIRKEAV